MSERLLDILIIDLLGGIGQLLLLLPVIHGLARRYPGAALRVITQAPGDVLLRGDPAVAAVSAPGGAAWRAVADGIAHRRPDLAISTARHDGVSALLAASGIRHVSGRAMQVLCAQGLLEPADDRPPRLHLSAAERVGGRRMLADALLPLPPRTPVLAVTDAERAVEGWPPRHWERFAELIGRAGHPMLTIGPALAGPALPRGDLRRLAACFAAVTARGGVVVGADTGLLRLAAAAGAPTVGLFGPTAAPDRRAGRRVQGLPDCPHRRPADVAGQVCWPAGDCPLSATGPACMADISPEQVARLALSGLRRRPRRPRTG